VVGAAVIVVAVVGVLVVFVGLPLTQTQFHYERQYPVGETRYVLLYISDFDTTPTDISINFVDNPDLMYSIDVEQYQPGHHHSTEYNVWDEHISIDVRQTNGGSQTSSIDITLGTGTSYVIAIAGSSELYVSVEYNNGAVLGEHAMLDLSCINSTLDFVFTENVNFTTVGLSVRTQRDIDVTVDIDLPSGMNGILTHPMFTSFSGTMVGWGQTSLTEISTSSTSEPLLDFSHVTSGAIGGSLRD